VCLLELRRSLLPKFLGRLVRRLQGGTSWQPQPHADGANPHHHITTIHNGRRRKDPVSSARQCLVLCTADLLLPRYPKHVWSPAGGWYAQPANWKANTFVVGAVLTGIVGATWMLSARLEYRDKMPKEGRFFPSR
jgi:hypothetical protein